MKKKAFENFEKMDAYVKLSHFADIGIGIAAAKTIEEAIKGILKKINEIFTAENCFLILVDKNTDELYYKLCLGIDADKMCDKRIKKEEGTAGWVFENKSPLLVEDISEDPRFASWFKKLVDAKNDSVIGVPLRVDEEIIGVIELINKSNKKYFTEREVKILNTIAEYAAITIEKIYYTSALRDLTNGDALTGVYNRRSFDTQIVLEMERCRRYGHPLALMLIDVDDLKTVNESLGPKKGDWVLRDLAQILKKNIRKIDVVARYSDDEFVILMPHTRREDGEVVKNRILADVKQENQEGKEIPYNISIGLHAVGPGHVYDLIRLTDEDLIKNKEGKRKI